LPVDDSHWGGVEAIVESDVDPRTHDLVEVEVAVDDLGDLAFAVARDFVAEEIVGEPIGIAEAFAPPGSRIYRVEACKREDRAPRKYALEESGPVRSDVEECFAVYRTAFLERT